MLHLDPEYLSVVPAISKTECASLPSLEGHPPTVYYPPGHAHSGEEGRAHPGLLNANESQKVPNSSPDSCKGQE